MKRILLLLALAPSAFALPHDPAVSRTHVAFIEAGKVWIVPRGGGVARTLADATGRTSSLRFSPDGQSIAYTDGNLYVLPVRGGKPSRVTWLPSEQMLCQWTADDRLLFFTNALSFSRIEMQLFTVSPRGELPAQLPPAYGADGAIDATGRWLAYTPHWPNPLIAHWKRYRGGAAPDVWLFDLQTRASHRITDWIGSDLRPMWHGATLYYLSDADEHMNIWAYDTKSGARRQVTHFRDYDVRNASIGPDAIVFELGPDIQLLDLRSGKSSIVRAKIPDTPLVRDVDASRFVTFTQTVNGTTLFEARGDLFIGSQIITATPGVFEREASLRPDGGAVAYWSDETGEYQLYISECGDASRRSSSGSQSGDWRRRTPITNYTSGFRYRPVWSPDGKRLAFVEQTGAIVLFDGTLHEIDREPWSAGIEPTELAWSPDSTWLAYTKTASNRLSTIWRYDLATGARQQLTSELFNASTPRFDGEHFLFDSYRNFSNVASDWIQSRIINRDLVTTMDVPLRGITFNVASFERRATRTNATPPQTPKVETPPLKMHVDLRAEWRELFVDAWRLYRDFFFAPKAPLADWPGVKMRYAAMLERCRTREEVNLVLAEMIGESSVGHAYIANGGDVTPAPPSDAATLGADFAVDGNAFRITRILETAPWDDTVRSPLRDAHEGELITAINGKPVDVSRDLRAALVGLAGKEVRITVADARFPIPEVPRESTSSDIAPRVLTVTTLASETDLRRRAWVEHNRRRVDEASHGRIGYVHIPDFTTNSFGDVARQFYGQIAKDALIIDARWSLGGSTGATLAELLARRPLNFAASRYSEHAYPAPRYGAHFGAKALLVNHITVSAGENFSYYFRKLALGPIVGTRTWGGLTGLNPVPALIDGGAVNVPNAPFFDDAGWLIEGHGLDPDVVVDGDPDAQLDTAIKALDYSSRPHD